MLEVTYTEPGIKGDTATNALKPLLLRPAPSPGAPLHRKHRRQDRVDTRDGSYVGRIGVVSPAALRARKYGRGARPSPPPCIGAKACAPMESNTSFITRSAVGPG